MKTSTLNSRLSIGILVVSIIFFGASIPYAAAQTPGLIVSDVVENGVADLNFQTTKDTSVVSAIAVYSDGSVGIPGNGCTAGGTGGLPAAPFGETEWILRDVGNNIAQITVSGVGIIVPTPFGGGSFSLTTAGASVTSAGGNPLHWDEIGTPNDGTDNDDTDVGGITPDDYLYGLCGTDNNIGQSPGGGGVGAAFNIVAPVGGEILPISTTALFMAGISNSALWMIPLVGMAGGAFVLLRYQVLKE